MSSLDNLRKAAKRWLKALRAGDASAAERLRRINPKAPGKPGLRDIQRALALERGFESWIALKKSLSAGDVLHPAAARGVARRGRQR